MGFGLIGAMAAGGVAGAGAGAGSAFKMLQDQQGKADQAKLENDFAIGRERLAAELRQQTDAAHIKAASEAYRDNLKFAETDPELIAAALAKRKGLAQTDIDVRLDPNNVKRGIDADTQAATAKNEVERKGKLALMNDPAYISGLAKEARARHIESAGSVAQAALINSQLQDKKVVQDLMNRYGAEADPAKKERLLEEIQVRTGKDNDSFVPIPRKDELGNVTGYDIFDKKRGKMRDQGGPSEDPLGIRATPQQKPSAKPEAKPEPKVESKPKALIDSTPSDPRAMQFDNETRQIEQGKLKDYSPAVKEWLMETQASPANPQSQIQQEQQRMLQQSKGLIR